MKSFIAASTITKFLPRFCLVYKTRNQQIAGGADQRSPPARSASGSPAGERRAQVPAAQAAFSGGCSDVVANPESAATIEVTQRYPRARKLAHKSSQTRQSRAGGEQASEILRTDVRADSLPVNPARIAMLEIQAASTFPVNPKFVAMLSGGNVRMAAGFNVRIHTDGGCSAHAQSATPPKPKESSSAGDSTLKRRTRVRNASEFPSRDFPTPEKTMRFPGTPIRRRR